MKIKNSIALVLGSGKGLGMETGMALARAGATVIFTHYDWPEESARMREEVAALGGNHRTFKVDLRKPDQIKRLLSSIQDEFDRLDILINNIERGGMPIVHGEYVPDQWQLELDTTLTSKWWVFHHSLPLLKASGDGIVINISSVAGIIGRAGPAGLIFNDGYAACNRAVSSFTETWARQAAPEVRVNELMLGIFRGRHAENTRGWELLSEDQRKALLGQTLLQRSGDGDDLIRAIFFLIEDAPYMTGSVIRLDGGFTLGHSPTPPMPEGVE